jgi:type II secretory pathway pseudopilin PulG
MKKALASVAAIAAVAAAVLWARNEQQRREDERRVAAMQSAVTALREGIRTFRQTRGRYPHSLGELPSIPVDPVTGSRDTWRVTTEETVQVSDDFTGEARAKPGATSVIIDVRSGASGRDINGRAWSDY